MPKILLNFINANNIFIVTCINTRVNNLFTKIFTSFWEKFQDKLNCKEEYQFFSFTLIYVLLNKRFFKNIAF